MPDFRYFVSEEVGFTGMCMGFISLSTYHTVRFGWGNDVLSIPIEGDRLVVKKATPGSQYQALQEILEKDWDRY